MIDDLEIVALSRDLPVHGLKAGDTGTVVMVYHDGEAQDVEFATAEGDTLELPTLRARMVSAKGSARPPLHPNRCHAS